MAVSMGRMEDLEVFRLPHLQFSPGREGETMLRLTFIVLIAFVSLNAETILFEDDFNDGNADGWMELVTGAQYMVQDSMYHFTAGAGVDHAASFNSDDPAGMTVMDYSVYAEFTLHSPTHGALVYLRTDFDDETGYFLYLRTYQDQIRICRHDEVGWVDLEEVPFAFENDQFYWVRFCCEQDDLMGKVWQGTMGDEPASWNITASDSVYSDPCFFGLGGVNISAQTGIDVEFDNVMVTDDPVLLEPYTWASIKSAY